MKIDLYQLFSPDEKQPERTETTENVRTLTLRKLEQAEAKRPAIRRPLRIALLAAAVAVSCELLQQDQIGRASCRERVYACV